MSSLAATTFRYFVSHTKNLYSLTEVLADGAHLSGRLSGVWQQRAEKVSAFCNVAAKGFYIRESLKAIRDFDISSPEKDEICQKLLEIVAFVALVAGVVTRELGWKGYRTIKVVEAGADLVAGMIDFSHAAANFKRESKEKVMLGHKICSVIFPLLALSSLWAGKENRHPYLSIAATVAYVGSDLIHDRLNSYKTRMEN